MTKEEKSLYLRKRSRSRVYHIFKKHKVKQPKRCFLCKKEDKLEKHHVDYNFPIHISWLCKSCHNKVHSNEVLRERVKKSLNYEYYEKTIIKKDKNNNIILRKVLKNKKCTLWKSRDSTMIITGLTKNIN